MLGTVEGATVVVGVAGAKGMMVGMEVGMEEGMEVGMEEGTAETTRTPGVVLVLVRGMPSQGKRSHLGKMRKRRKKRKRRRGGAEKGVTAGAEEQEDPV